MRMTLVGISTMLLLGLLTLDCSARRAWCDKPVPAEPAPTFRASDLLVSDILRGPNYTIDEFVQVENYKYRFNLNTEWGVIPVHGLNMLELRLREMYAIENARQLAQDPQFIEGIFQTVRNTPQGIKILLTEPQGALLRAPKGFERMVRGKLDPADRRAGSENRRRLAVEVGCDPETTNPVLKSLLDGIALRKGLGGFATKVGLGLALPGLGLLPTTAEIKEMVATKAPHEINNHIDEELAGFGVPDHVRQQFCREISYTTTQRLLILQQLRSLRHVRNMPVLVERAIEATTESEGLSVLQELKMLNELNQRDPVEEIQNLGLPLARTKSGGLVIISAADYITNTPEVMEAIAAHRRDHPNTPTTFFVAGRVSPLAKQSFAAAKIEVLER